VNLQRAGHVAAKDLRLGPRSPILLFAIVMPLVITFLVAAVFGSLFDQRPRLAIVDLGDSEIPEAAAGLSGIDVTTSTDPSALAGQVERHDVDAGIVLPAGFDDAIRAGARPDLEFLVSGRSLASTRAVLAVTTIDLVRGVAGGDPPVEIATTVIGAEDYVPLGDRLIPLTVFYAVVIAGMFLPASSLVEERQKRTMDAVLVTPLRMQEILTAKAAVGILLATVMGLITLALNRAFGANPGAMILFLVLGAVMVAEFGLVLGCWARDVNTLYTAIKGGGIFIFLPALFALFPGLPQWIGRIAPTYYFLQPIYDLGARGASFGSLWDELAVCLAIIALLLPAVAAMGRRAERHLAIVT
jgi:ABC-2 type transport system permease protein